MGDDAYPTEMAGAAEAHTEAAYAWSLDYEDDTPTQRLTPRRITAFALAGSLVLIAAAGAVALLAIRGVWHIEEVLPIVAAPTDSPTLVTPTTTVRAQPGPWFTAPPRPPPTATVTVQAPPSTIPAPPPPPTELPAATVAVFDQQFLAHLRQEGWVITNPAAMANNAHIVCEMVRQGQPPEYINGLLMANARMSSTEALLFSSAAMLDYPSCR